MADREPEFAAGQLEPRPEDGHLRMPNELVDRLAQLRLNGTQWQILWALWRKTLCWQKSGRWKNEPHKITAKEFGVLTGLNRTQLRRELTTLMERNIVVSTDTHTYAFNLNHVTWLGGQKGRQLATLRKCSQSATVVSPISDNLGENVADPLQVCRQLATSPDTKTKLGKKLNKRIKETEINKGAKKIPPPDPRVKIILNTISEELGVQIPFYAKEGAAVKRALQMGFTEGQIVGCWRKMKTFAFWKGKWLPLAKVTENVGDFVAGRLIDGRPRDSPGKAAPRRTPVHEAKDFESGEW